MKKALTVLSIIAVMVAAYIVLFPKNNPIKKLFTKKPPPDPTSQPSNNNTGGTPGNSYGNPRGTNNSPAGFPLMEGSRGLYVTQLQSALNKHFGANLKADGIFGPKTALAVVSAKFDPTNVTYPVYLDILNG